jgi:hypothetical protein
MRAKPHFHFHLGLWWVTVGGRTYATPNHLFKFAKSGISSMSRSNSAAVRNPIAADPEVERELMFLSANEKAALARMLKRLSAKWREKAEHAWRKHKPPMAAYWKQNAVNARHLALALSKTATK